MEAMILYILINSFVQRDEDDMIEWVRTAPTEFREYYIQMQASKRSQTPLPSQVTNITALHFSHNDHSFGDLYLFELITSLNFIDGVVSFCGVIGE
jgi:hypothetical protein